MVKLPKKRHKKRSLNEQYYENKYKSMKLSKTNDKMSLDSHINQI